jgi:hypothetical protein
MPIAPYVNQLDTKEDAVIWRFMSLWKFRDLMASEELYFRRADLFSDESEGLPPEQYVIRAGGLNAYDLSDRTKLNDQLGFIAQNRESYYISCWYLFREETLDMWAAYGESGVAVCSTYGLLKSALQDFLDAVQVGLVRYDTTHFGMHFNVLEFIMTKQPQYSRECEVRALLNIPDPLAGGSRHVGLDNAIYARPLDMNPRNPWVPDGKRRRVSLRALLTGIVISPWAEPDDLEEIRTWAKSKGLGEPRTSGLASSLTPTLEDFTKYQHLASPRFPEPPKTIELPANQEQLQEFSRVFSRLSPWLLRFNYRQYWEACRLNRGSLPSVAHAQYLEATLRVLEAQRQLGIDIWSAEASPKPMNEGGKP